MKKLILSILLAAVLLFTSLSLTSCGNQDYFDMEQDTYKYVHCISSGKCYKIKSWKNNEIGIKVTTESYGIMYFSEGTYILVGDKCPICNHS